MRRQGFFTGALACAGLLLLSAACDTLVEPGEPPPSMSVQVLASQAAARAKAEAIVEAAEAMTSSCVAGEVLWEADPSGYVVPRHFSRPCLPEVCKPSPQSLAALKTSTHDLKQLVDSDVSLQVPSYLGLVALAEAMVGFAEAALEVLDKAKAAAAVIDKDRSLRGTATYANNPLADKSQFLKRNVSPLSGLSLHYTAIASAVTDIYPDAKVTPEPPSLTKSLAAEQPGGDPCKGWALPQYCDVSGVRVPAKRQWRTDPACISLESVMK